MTIPIALKTKLIELSRHLLPSQRQGFLHNVVQRLDNLALTYPRTVIYGAAGYCVGQIIDAITGLPAGLPGLLSGGLFGLHRDIHCDHIQTEVSRVIGEELRRHREFEI